MENINIPNVYPLPALKVRNFPFNYLWLLRHISDLVVTHKLSISSVTLTVPGSASSSLLECLVGHHFVSGRLIDLHGCRTEDCARGPTLEIAVDVTRVVSSHIHSSNIAFGSINIASPETIVIEVNRAGRTNIDIHSHLVWKAGRQGG
jgi:hypothetical protein